MKSQKNINLIILVLLLALAVYFIAGLGKRTMISSSQIDNNQDFFDPQNTSYQIEGQNFLLTAGKSEVTIAGSAGQIITRYFGNDARGDLNGDNKEDLAYLLTQERGGSGVFYYVVVALSNGQNYQATNVVFLGDRIAPQTSEIKDQKLIVNYADRNPDEPMSTSPTQGVSKYLQIVDGQLIAL